MTAGRMKLFKSLCRSHVHECDSFLHLTIICEMGIYVSIVGGIKNSESSSVGRMHYNSPSMLGSVFINVLLRLSFLRVRSTNGTNESVRSSIFLNSRFIIPQTERLQSWYACLFPETLFVQMYCFVLNFCHIFVVFFRFFNFSRFTVSLFLIHAQFGFSLISATVELLSSSKYTKLICLSYWPHREAIPTQGLFSDGGDWLSKIV